MTFYGRHASRLDPQADDRPRLRRDAGLGKHAPPRRILGSSRPDRGPQLQIVEEVFSRLTHHSHHGVAAVYRHA